MRFPILATVAGGSIAVGILFLSRGPSTSDAPSAPPHLVSRALNGSDETRNPGTAGAPLPVDRSARTTRAPRVPTAAIRSLQISRGLGHNRSVIRLIFLRLSSIDRSRAVEMALRLPGAADRRLAIETIAKKFVRSSDIRRQAGENRGIPTRDQRLTLFLARGALPPLLVARVAAHERANSPAASLASRAVSTEAQSNPARAFALAKLLHDEAAGVAAVAEGWARTSPRSASEWVLAIPDPAARAASLSQIALTTANRDAAFAASLVSEMPLSAKRNETMHGVASVWARVDTEAAMRWAESLPTPTESQAALAAIRQIAPTGVGIALSQPRNSPYPTATELIPNSPASKSGGIRTGDSIVAIGDGSGRWTSTQNRRLDSVVELIRGDPGRPVQIQILPAGTTDPSRVQTVTLTREQLLFKRPQPGLPDAGST